PWSASDRDSPLATVRTGTIRGTASPEVARACARRCGVIRTSELGVLTCVRAARSCTNGAVRSALVPQLRLWKAVDQPDGRGADRGACGPIWRVRGREAGVDQHQKGKSRQADTSTGPGVTFRSDALGFGVRCWPRKCFVWRPHRNTDGPG